MNNVHFSIKKDAMHLWVVFLPDFFAQEAQLSALLSPDELARAERFRIAKARQQFIVARALLRKTLSLYTGIAAEALEFYYGAKGKPYLHHSFGLQFNVSHSHEVAVYALTRAQEIGVDIEYVTAEFKGAIAKRFFSAEEQAYLTGLSGTEQVKMFYQLWARKEALIKALGEGFYTPIEKISVDLKKNSEWVELKYHDELCGLHVEEVDIYPGYQAAVAMAAAPCLSIEKWQWDGLDNAFHPCKC